MKSFAKLLLIVLSVATIVPAVANPATEKNDEQVTLSQEECSKLHWVGLATSLWLLKMSVMTLTVPGLGMVMAPDRLVEQAIAAQKATMPEDRHAAIENSREVMVAGMKAGGTFLTLLGMSSTYLSAKLTWFFAKKKIKGSNA